MRKTTKVALCGMISALSLLFMFLTGLFPFATYALPAISGAILIVICIEYDIKWAYVVFVAVSLLSLFIAPDKEAVAMFIAFFGHYPITKSLIEKVKNRILEFVIKYAIFNVSMIASFFLIINIFGLTRVLDEFQEFGKYSMLIMLAIGNVIFIIYDIALTRAISAYIHWFKPKFLKRF